MQTWDYVAQTCHFYVHKLTSHDPTTTAVLSALLQSLYVLQDKQQTTDTVKATDLKLLIISFSYCILRALSSPM